MICRGSFIEYYRDCGRRPDYECNATDVGRKRRLYDEIYWMIKGSWPEPPFLKTVKTDDDQLHEHSIAAIAGDRHSPKRDDAATPLQLVALVTSSSIGCRGPPVVAAALTDVVAGASFWISGQDFISAEFIVRLPSGRSTKAEVLSLTTNGTSCASSALLVMPKDAGTGPFGLSVKSPSGESSTVVLGAPVVDWASPFIVSEPVYQHDCLTAVYGRNLDSLSNPTIELTPLNGASLLTTAFYQLSISSLTESRGCFSTHGLGLGKYTVKLCGQVTNTLSAEDATKLCTDGRATTEVIANPQPSKQRIVNASEPPYSLDASGKTDVTAGLRQAILDATLNGTQARGRVILGRGSFLLDPRNGVPSPELDSCAICKLGSAFQVDLVGEGRDLTKLVVGPGTDAAFSAALVGLSNLTLSDTPTDALFRVNGTSIRALWTMTKLAVIPPGAKTPAESTGMQEMAVFAGTDIAFRSVRFVSHRVGTGLSLRYLKRAVVEDCEFISGNLALWGPLSDIRILGNRGILNCDGSDGVKSTGLGCGGFIDALGWGGAGHATDFVITGNTLRHLHSLEESRFPGRFFVGQNYLLRRMYLADNINHEAGPGAISDQNKGEQVLLEVGDTDIYSRVLSVDGSHLTLNNAGGPTDVLKAFATRAGKNNDGSTIAEAWSYFRGIGLISIQSGVGAGQWRTVVGIDNDTLELDRPFDVSPDSDSGLAICASSAHDIILSGNEFIGAFAKNHTTQEPHVATAAIFIWASKVHKQPTGLLLASLSQSSEEVACDSRHL